MDVEKAIAAGGEEGTRAAETERLRMFTKVLRYSLFLYFGTVAAVIAPMLAPACRPAFVPSLPAGYGFPVTCAVFTVATQVVQEMLARVLQRPAPAPRLTPEDAWPLITFTWTFVTMFFLGYLSFGGDDYFVRSCSEWRMAGYASALNLGFAARTVADRTTWLECGGHHCS